MHLDIVADQVRSGEDRAIRVTDGDDRTPEKGLPAVMPQPYRRALSPWEAEWAVVQSSMLHNLRTHAQIPECREESFRSPPSAIRQPPCQPADVEAAVKQPGFLSEPAQIPVIGHGSKTSLSRPSSDRPLLRSSSSSSGSEDQPIERRCIAVVQLPGSLSTGPEPGTNRPL